MLQWLKNLRQHLLTGVSYAIPFIACGGILIAIAVGLAMTPTGPDFSHSPRLKLILDIGLASFSLMLSVLAGYISYSIADRPGLVPGFIGGYLAGEVKAGFLGAILIGLLSGYLVLLIKKIPVGKYLRPIMPILVIPVLSSAVTGVIMLKVVGIPIAHFMNSANLWLKTMSTGNSVVLAMILGAMIAFDMGGPINKTAFFFSAAMISEGNYRMMGASAAAICTPPLGLGVATLLRKKLWSEEDQEAGLASLAMGMVGITEGAIPFAAADPVGVIPCIVVGSMVASVVAMIGGVGDRAPHGGPIVMAVGAVDNKLAYVLAIIAGTLVTAFLVNVVKSMSERTATKAAEAA